MKKLFFTPFLFISLLLSAQKEVTSAEIIQQINDGKQVMVEDAIIRGKLDLTELINQEIKNKSGDYREYKSVVKAPLTFRNCTFRGDVIAYKNIQDGETSKKGNVSVTWGGKSETYSTDFDEAVAFENCVFEGKAEFKYSTFNEAVSFEGTAFRNSANFKYAKFKNFAGFGNGTFDQEANFKYASFSEDADFFRNKFNGYANFKYAKFDSRVTYKKSDFNNAADFKYTNISKEAIFTDARFSSNPDFKYTKGKRYMN